MRSSRHNQRWPRPRDGPSHRLAITVPCCAHFREGPVLAILAMLALKDALCVAPGGSAPLFPFRSAPWPPMFQAGTGKRRLNRTRKPARHDRSHALTTQKGTSWRCGNRGHFGVALTPLRTGHSLRPHQRIYSRGGARLRIAARFYAARGFEKFASVYFQYARYGYLRWGADGKVRQLDQLYPQLSEKEPAPGPTITIGAPVEHLDLATVIKVSQAVSGEIVLEKMLDTLMRTAIAQAGAERGLLILTRAAEPRIEAEAMTGGDAVIVHTRDETVNPSVLPASVLHYVLCTREGVILDDATTQPAFAADPYIRERQARSILCLSLGRPDQAHRRVVPREQPGPPRLRPGPTRGLQRSRQLTRLCSLELTH